MARYRVTIPDEFIRDSREDAVRGSLDQLRRYVELGARPSVISWDHDFLRREWILTLDVEEANSGILEAVLAGVQRNRSGSFNLGRNTGRDVRMNFDIRSTMTEERAITRALSLASTPTPTQQQLAEMTPNRSVLDRIMSEGLPYAENKKGEKVPVKPKEPPAPKKRRMNFRE